MVFRIQNPEFRIRSSDFHPLDQADGSVYPEVEVSETRFQVEDSKPKRPPARTFENLVVWQRAHTLVLTIYRLSDGFPSRENFSLTSQLRRAAISVPANIAEGFKKRGFRDKLRFLNIAQGSLEECRYFLILTRDLGYADTAEAIAGLAEVSRLLESYHRTILDSEF